MLSKSASGAVGTSEPGCDNSECKPVNVCNESSLEGHRPAIASNSLKTSAFFPEYVYVVRVVPIDYRYC